MSLGSPVCLTLTSFGGGIRWSQQHQSQQSALLRVCHQVYTKTATMSRNNLVWIIFGGLDTRNYVTEFRYSSIFLSFPAFFREALLSRKIASNIFNCVTFPCPFSHSSHTLPLYSESSLFLTLSCFPPQPHPLETTEESRET